MKKVKISVDSFESQLLREFFYKIAFSNSIVSGFELEHLVLLDLHRKNYLKLSFEQHYKISMLPHEAVSMYRVLHNLGLHDPLGGIARDAICQKIGSQIQIKKHA